jgi:hypothetical protein
MPAVRGLPRALRGQADHVPGLRGETFRREVVLGYGYVPLPGSAAVVPKLGANALDELL